MTALPPRPCVWVVDDDAMVRAWVRMVCEAAGAFRVTGEAGSVREGLQLSARHHPDLLLLDHRLPDGTGIELLRQLRERGVTAPAVIATANALPGLNEAAAEAGARGVVLKRGDAAELTGALMHALHGERVFEPAHPRRSRGQGEPLSPREREVLGLAAQGLGTKEVAARLGLGPETVKTLLSRMYRKLGASNRADAITKAHDLGLI